MQWRKNINRFLNLTTKMESLKKFPSKEFWCNNTWKICLFLWYLMFLSKMFILYTFMPNANSILVLFIIHLILIQHNSFKHEEMIKNCPICCLTNKFFLLKNWNLSQHVQQMATNVINYIFKGNGPNFNCYRSLFLNKEKINSFWWI